MVLIAHRHRGSCIAGHDLHGILSGVDSSITLKQGFVDTILIGGGDTACGVIGLIESILL